VIGEGRDAAAAIGVCWLVGGVGADWILVANWVRRVVGLVLLLLLLEELGN
jgi:hypothetical protein